MISRSTWKVQIRFQNESSLETVVPVNGIRKEEGPVSVGVSAQEEKGILCAGIDLKIRTVTLEDPPGLSAAAPVRIRIPMTEIPEKITASYLFGPWWTRPFFTEDLRDIPEKTQFAAFKLKDRCLCLLPMVGKNFRTSLRGGEEGEILLEMSACMGGFASACEPLFLMAQAPTVMEAVHRIFLYLSEKEGLRLRGERNLPEMFRYLGWCSWDAFYTEVSEDKIRTKAQELVDKQVPVRWILIDDGWFGAREKMLSDFMPDPAKFPRGFLQMIRDIRKTSAVRWFGVWHALGGYWDGIAPGSPAALEAAESLMENPTGRLLPHPVRGAAFYRTWYEKLRREGIDFVKVDGQSAVPMYYKNCMALPEAARNISFSVESGAAVMGGAVINCMGMAMENVLARPATAVSRNSDDFFPSRESSFIEHLLENAYNAVYHNEIYCCDWDMFWTCHPRAGEHALLRAVSGGPVYVSDRIGATDPEVLKPLVFLDGRILMMERSAMPTEDCLFTDPLQEGVLKIHNYGLWGGNQKAGGIAAFNLTGKDQTFDLSPSDIPELAGQGPCQVYDFMEKSVCRPDSDGIVHGILKAGEYKWFVFVPQGINSACLGLSDKYAGFLAVEAAFTEGDRDMVLLREGGTVTWISERKPAQVTASGKDMTDHITSRGSVHSLALPESRDRILLNIVWTD